MMADKMSQIVYNIIEAYMMADRMLQISLSNVVKLLLVVFGNENKIPQMSYYER